MRAEGLRANPHDHKDATRAYRWRTRASRDATWPYTPGVGYPLRCPLGGALALHATPLGTLRGFTRQDLVIPKDTRHSYQLLQPERLRIPTTVPGIWGPGLTHHAPASCSHEAVKAAFVGGSSKWTTQLDNPRWWTSHLDHPDLSSLRNHLPPTITWSNGESNPVAPEDELDEDEQQQDDLAQRATPQYAKALRQPLRTPDTPRCQGGLRKRHWPVHTC